MIIRNFKETFRANLRKLICKICYVAKWKNIPDTILSEIVIPQTMLWIDAKMQLRVEKNVYTGCAVTFHYAMGQLANYA